MDIDQLINKYLLRESKSIEATFEELALAKGADISKHNGKREASFNTPAQADRFVKFFTKNQSALLAKYSARVYVSGTNVNGRSTVTLSV